MSTVTVKSVFNGDIRRFAVKEGETLESFRETLGRLYYLQKPFEVRYTNLEGEDVPISSDTSLWNALTTSTTGIPKVTIFLVDEPVIEKVIIKEALVVEEKEAEPVPKFTQDPLQKQVLTAASATFETLLQNSLMGLFKKPEFQEKLLGLIQETITSKAFSDIIQNIIPEVLNTVESTSTASQADVDEIAQFEQIPRPSETTPEVIEEAIVEEPEVVEEKIVDTVVEIVEEPKEEQEVKVEVEVEEPVSEKPFEPEITEPVLIPIAHSRPEEKHPKASSPSKKPLLPSFISSMLGLGESKPKDYTSQLKQLEDMGFSDRELNVKVLDKCKGSVEHALERLLAGSH